MDGDELKQAVRESPGDLIAGLKTEMLTVQDLARFFGVSRRTMSGLLSKIPGVEQLGGFYRVRLSEMPPKYFIKRGLIWPIVLQAGPQENMGRSAHN